MKTSTHESLVNRMREMGFRVTGQRKVLVSLLENSSSHLDADTLLQQAQRIDPSIHRATVYRTLNTLKKAGLLDELDDGYLILSKSERGNALLQRLSTQPSSAKQLKQASQQLRRARFHRHMPNWRECPTARNAIHWEKKSRTINAWIL